ncbi:hypothetical protein QL285_029164 [Trifolium repens]|nr:hypothetical protein QL285_029164 [Trifolium repens]
MVERKNPWKNRLVIFSIIIFTSISLLLNLWFLFVYIISPEKKIAQREEELESGWVSGEKQKNIRQVVGERKYSRRVLAVEEDVSCALCGEEKETELHLFLYCEIVVQKNRDCAYRNNVTAVLFRWPVVVFAVLALVPVSCFVLPCYVLFLASADLGFLSQLFCFLL